MRRIMIEAPCSTSNLGPGFDVFGLALDILHDVADVELVEEEGVFLKVEGVEADRIPTDPERNSAGKAALEFLKRHNGKGLKINLRKGVPPGSGLGSTGTSAAATVVAINHLLGTSLDNRDLVEIAAQGEIAAAGAPHADNVAPSICGGVTIISSYKPLRVTWFPPPRDLVFSVALPRGIQKTTKKARAVLPKSVRLSETIRNIGSSSLVLAGLLRSDPKLLGEGMAGDVIVEPKRIPLYPGCAEAKKAAMDVGALGATLSGAGPTMIAIADPERGDPLEVANAMKAAFIAQGISCEGYVGRPTEGARTVS